MGNGERGGEWGGGRGKDEGVVEVNTLVNF